MITIKTICEDVQSKHNNISLDRYRNEVKKDCRKNDVQYNQSIVDRCHNAYFGGF